MLLLRVEDEWEAREAPDQSSPLFLYYIFLVCGGHCVREPPPSSSFFIWDTIPRSRLASAGVGAGAGARMEAASLGQAIEADDVCVYQDACKRGGGVGSLEKKKHTLSRGRNETLLMSAIFYSFLSTITVVGGILLEVCQLTLYY